MNKKAECVRNVANWSVATRKNVFDNASFDATQVADIIPSASPKMKALFDKIRELDENDKATHGTYFKHMIFTDVKSAMHGAKMIASSFLAYGYDHAYDSKLHIDPAKLQKKEFNNFALLCSSTVYGKPMRVKLRKQILEMFNSRPENVHGELIRFIILDPGFKEGIDLYDIKYVHIFDEPITNADRTQIIGRGTRMCGQRGLTFDPAVGWPLHVIQYSMSIPPELQTSYQNASSLFEIFAKLSGMDMQALGLANNLEKVCIHGAVDHDLTENVHSFTVDAPTKMSIDGGAKKKHVKHANPPRTKKNFAAMREYIRERFGEKYIWKKAELENLCDPVDGGTNIMTFNETQEFVRQYFQPSSAYKGMLLWHSTGTGKCHALDTPILMHDGSIKMVQDIVVGDMLMGDDSTPRRVLSLAQGRDRMFTISSSDVEYCVNGEHILCLRVPGSDAVLEITVDDYLKMPSDKRAKLCGYRVSVDFPTRYVDIDAYTYAFLLNELDAFIPNIYMRNDRYVRLQFLAGLIDRVQSLDITLLHPQIADDIIFLCRSLGLNAVRIDDATLRVCGDDGLDEIPLRFPIHYEYTRNVRTYQIHVDEVGYGTYYGFTLDGNNRYLMGDFSVTHNTCSAIAVASTSWERHGYNIIWVTRHTLKPDIWKNMYTQICSLTVKNRIIKGELPEDGAAKQPIKNMPKQWIQPMSYKQFSNMLAKKNDFYIQMVRRNGEDDILRKTLVIIDEAHKLFARDVPPSEKSNVKLIYQSILDSYDVSGTDSVRVLLMTATPYTTDPMNFIRLINLLKPRDEQIPEDFKDFAKTYLNDRGEFTIQGEQRLLDDIAGYISYLNREKDARQFAYPVLQYVDVPLSTSETRLYEQYNQDLNTQVSVLSGNLQEGKDAVKKAKQRIKEDKKRMTDECKSRPTAPERKKCKEDVATHMNVFEKRLLGELNAKIETDTVTLATLKDQLREIKTKLKKVKNDTSVQTALETKCKITQV